jgi:hypothetical protein
MIMKQHISSRPAMKASLTAALAVLLSCGSSLHAEDIDTANLDSITNAPIIESGRLVGTITNTEATLNDSIMVPLFYQPVLHPDHSVSGKIVNNVTVDIDPSITKVHVLKVEDDMATIFIKDKNLPFLPPVQVHYSFINELTNLPHLTDSNPNWKSTAQVMTSLDGVKDRFMSRYVEPTLTPHTGAPPPPSEYHNNYRNIPWHHSKVEDEYQNLNVPITTEAPIGDSSAIVAVANALSYLYTKANTNPTQVSKSFLTWAHDAYPLNDNELNTAWHPSDYVNPKTIIEGERHDRVKWDFAQHPHFIAAPVSYGNEHQIDLGRLLKGVQRFGVALEAESPSNGRWNNPSADTIATAKDRGNHHPLIVRSFNSWNDMSLMSKCSDLKDHIIKMDTYQALFLAFVTKEVTAGHPVLVTYLKKTAPKSNTYQKRTFVITGTSTPTRHQSLQFLTPSGKFETYNSFGESTPAWGEVMSPDPSNPHAAVIRGEPYRYLLVKEIVPIWKDVETSPVAAQRLGVSGSTNVKFEVYSLGLN